MSAAGKSELINSEIKMEHILCNTGNLSKKFLNSKNHNRSQICFEKENYMFKTPEASSNKNKDNEK